MSDRNWNLALLAAKEETTDGTEAAPTVGEMIGQLVEPFAADYDYAFLNPNPRQVRGAIIEAARPLSYSGRMGTWNYSVLGRGSRDGGVYSATPGSQGGIELQPILLSAGCSVTHSGGAGSEIATVRPAATALKSATLHYYQDGTLYKLLGAKSEIAIEIDAGGPVRFNITSTGLYPGASAAALPTPTAAQLGSRLPPIAENVTVTMDLGGGAGNIGVLRRFRMGLGNSVQQRPSFAASTALAPFKIRSRAPTWSIVVEQPVAGAGPPVYDWEGSFVPNVVGTLAFTIGSVQYNRLVFTLRPVISQVRKQDDNGTIVVEVSGTLHSGDGVALDAFEIRFT